MYSLRRFGIKLGLDVIGHLLSGLGNPHLQYSVIHIAGTNGKGSIAATLASILRTSGYRTGLYTSPHLMRFNERICVDGRAVSDAEVVSACRAVQDVTQTDREPTFFEYTTAMALFLFAQRKVDWAIIETGMGGRLDATNLLSPAVSIVSNISLEHQSYLGNTLKEIAFEKAGIVKNDTPVVTGIRQPTAFKVLEETAHRRSAPLFRLGKQFRVRRQKEGRFSYYGLDHCWKGLQTPLQGAFQVDNAAFALAACELLIRKGVTLPIEALRIGLADVRWPGRLEVVGHQPTLLLDGAHNLAAATILGKYLKEHFAGRPITLVVGILDDKPYEKMMAQLLPHCRRVLIAMPRIDRSLNGEILLAIAKRQVQEATIEKSVAAALARALESTDENGVVCVAGSLYVVGEAKEALEEWRRQAPSDNPFFRDT